MITPLQRQVRNQGVGASECASVLGIDPWRSAYDLWLLKTEKHEETGDDYGTESQEIGNLIEDTTAALAERRMGRRLVKPTGTYKHDNGVMFANLDRQVDVARRGSENCELKSTGVSEGWGEAGSEDIPERVLVQVTAQMMCSGADVSHIARLLGARGFSFFMYRVNLNPSLAEIIEERVCDFWRNNVEKDCPPAHSLPSIGVVSHIRRTAGKVIELSDPSVVERFAQARDSRIAIEKAEEKARVELLAALGDAEGCKAPGWSVSFKTINTKRLDTAALKIAHPDIYAAHEKSSGYRKLDVRESKK